MTAGSPDTSGQRVLPQAVSSAIPGFDTGQGEGRGIPRKGLHRGPANSSQQKQALHYIRKGASYTLNAGLFFLDIVLALHFSFYSCF